MSRNRVLICVLCFISCAMASPAGGAKPASGTKPGESKAAGKEAARPNVVLITLDTTRADRMGFLGSKLGLTPNLDALARESAVFTHAYSQVPLTTASHATILTGTYPQFHKVNDFAIPLAKDLPYAPDLLRHKGYHTAAFVSSLILDPAAGTAPGFDRGFDTYDAGFHHGMPGEDRYETIERRADETVAHALAWLKEHPKGPFFVWVHLYDAHDPYDPPEPYKTKYASALYDGEIAYEDAAVGKLLHRLRTGGLYDNTMIAVMADHGESLGAHGEDTHGVFLYDETIRVPLVIKLPHAGGAGTKSAGNPAGAGAAGKSAAGKSATGTRIDSPVGLVNVLPTILEATGIPIPQEVQGESLLELVTPAAAVESKTSEAPSQPVYSVSDYPQLSFGWSSLQSWRTSRYLYIDAPRKELYDELTDAKAEHNLSATSAAVSETLGAQLKAFQQKTKSDRAAPTATEDPEMQEKLAALGYVGANGATVVASGAKESGADPKDKIEIENLFHQAAVKIETQQFDEAIPLLEQVVAKEPDMAKAYQQLAESYKALREYPKAAAAARKAVELRPEWATPHFLLGQTLAATKDYKAAALEFENVVKQVPRWVQAHEALGSAYVRTNRLPEAIKEYQTAIELDPDFYSSYLLLGRVLTATGDNAGALEKLTKAVTLNPTAPEPHRFLADLYEQMGQKDDARKERDESESVAAQVEAEAQGTPLPNIIVITLDTTRADRMGFLGSTRGLTPSLDRLAKESVVFTHAYSQAPLTPASHATILTGTYPQFHQVLDFLMPLAKDVPFAPDILRTHGYRTGAFVGSLALDPVRTVPGFDRGFDTYDANFNPTGFDEKTRYHTVERRGAEVLEHAEAWLPQHQKGPFFLWMHLYDPHDPYDPPEPYKTKYASEPYDGEIAYVDSVIGKLVSHLKTHGLFENTVIAIMADHGEALGAHGEDTHGIFLYDETIQVPLVIKLPGEVAGGKRVETRVELVDVLPTLLQAARLPIPGAVQGESLLPIMVAERDSSGDANAWRNRPAYSQADYSHFSYGWSSEQALRTGKYLYVQAPRPELYDQTADAGAEHDLSKTSAAVTNTLGQKLNAFVQKTSSKKEAPTAVMADPAEQAKLAALGYVATGSSQSTAGSTQQADPKDKILVADLIRRADVLLEGKQFEAALPMLEKLISMEPGMALLYQKSGGCFMMLHQYDKALPMFRKALELNPDLPGAHITLATALIQAQDYAGAATELESVIAKVPDLVEAHILLAGAYAKTNRVPETIKECQTVLKFLPEDYQCHLTLGQFLAKTGDTDGAVVQLTKAVAVAPKASDPHSSLADVYDQMGRKEEAAKEREEAKRLSRDIDQPPGAAGSGRSK